MMGLDNSKAYLLEKQDIYDNYVKRPLRELQSELSRTISEIDSELCTIPGRCISGIYNDVRFGNRDKPLRDYMWVRFKYMRSRSDDIPGFFFDASHDGYRYGLRIYKMTTGGMQKIRKAILDDPGSFRKLARQLEKSGSWEISGNEYAKDHYPGYEPILKKWLNKKDFFIHCTRDVSQTYYSHDLVDELAAGYNSLVEIYGFLKRALYE